MSNKDTTILILTAIAGILGYFLIQEANKNKANTKRIKALEKDRLKLMKDAIENSDHLSKEIKDQIHKLIDEYQEIDEEVAKELVSVLSLVNIGQHEQAIKDLAKIIENMLSEKYKDESKFKSFKKYIPLAKLIEHAKEVKFFSSKEYNASCILKDIRNEVSHELNVRYGSNWQVIGLLGGIEIIFKLKGNRIN